MENNIDTISNGYDDRIKLTIKSDTMERLKQYIPIGCPFKKYTMFDLLTDWIKMYSWQIEKYVVYSLIDFVKSISGDAKVEIYRSSMIELLS